jgi:hypothetical protein
MFGVRIDLGVGATIRAKAAQAQAFGLARLIPADLLTAG